MPRDNEPAIEVEVIEIDGAAPPPPRLSTTHICLHAPLTAPQFLPLLSKWP